MPSYTIVGLCFGSYISNKTGEPVHFTRIYTTYPHNLDSLSSHQFEGLGVEAFFIPRRLSVLKVGDVVEPVYNKYGTCIDIKII